MIGKHYRAMERRFIASGDALRGYREALNWEVEVLKGYGDAREGHEEVLQCDRKH